MPSLQKFHANVSRHVRSMDKNLCANLIRHEYIVTGRAKAKRAQSKIESFLAKAINNDRAIRDKDIEYRLNNNRAFNFLQAPDKVEIGTKVISELADRYPERSHGFTRIIKLEPRLGEDKAPMSVLELVDSEFEIKLWYTAKIVARLELQGLELDDLTQHNMNKLIGFRKEGEARFREAVETSKKEFFSYNAETGEIESEEVKTNLQNLPTNLEYHGGSLTGKLLVSKKFKTRSREVQTQVELPKSPYLEEGRVE